MKKLFLVLLVLVGLSYADDSSKGQEQIYFQKGIMAYNNGKVDDAIVYYKKALEINPSFKEVYANLASAYLDKGDVKNGLAMMKKGCNLGDSVACSNISAIQ